MLKLFEPITIGAIDAPNRILMAPMTRGRATQAHVPTTLMLEYYAQRASAGLIITEATGINQQGLGWPSSPGIWSKEQVAAWKPIVRAVHAAGGRIVSQLWHMGRLVHPDFLAGHRPVSASATTAPNWAHTYSGKQRYVQSRALEYAEIQRLVNDYRRAAENGLAAGFDGVELHAATGYLIDQFLRDGTNKRQDQYGGSIENRLRLLIEVTEALIETVGADRTGVRLSPNDDSQGCSDSNSAELFAQAATELNHLEIAFLDLRASRPESTLRPAVRQVVPAMRRAFKGILILNSDYTFESALRTVELREADAIAFGRAFLANPDLPNRFARNRRLNKPDASTFYSPGRAGYTDYPALEQS